ncbi:MAG: LptA/OstA family protein [Enterobacterales bacterium]|nr:LptA/OstA family protein [Enterobacterales bacterium]
MRTTQTLPWIVFSLFSILLWQVSASVLAQNKKNNVILKQGQFYLASDSSRIDGINGIFEYKGHAQYKEPGLSINADHLIGRKNKKGQFKSFTAYGSPAIFSQINPQTGDRLELKANVIKFYIIKQQLIAEINASLVQQSKSNNRLTIEASKITVKNQSSKQRQISGKGKPLLLTVVNNGQQELSASANQLVIKSESEGLLLSGDVIAKQQDGTVSAGTFRYNRITKISSFEKSNAEQVEIIQTKSIDQ